MWVPWSFRRDSIRAPTFRIDVTTSYWDQRLKPLSKWHQSIGEKCDKFSSSNDYFLFIWLFFFLSFIDAKHLDILKYPLTRGFTITPRGEFIIQESLRKKERAGSRQGEDSTSGEIPCLQDLLNKKPFSVLPALSSHQCSTAHPSPFHILGSVAANVGRKGDALSSLALMISIK